MAQFWERFANWLGDHLGCSPCDVGGLGALPADPLSGAVPGFGGAAVAFALKIRIIPKRLGKSLSELGKINLTARQIAERCGAPARLCSVPFHQTRSPRLPPL